MRRVLPIIRRDMSNLDAILTAAVAEGRLLASAKTNIDTLIKGSSSDLAVQVIGELAADGHWNELNDRFYKTLAFGTGGLRGRTIGRVVANPSKVPADPMGARSIHALEPRR